MLQTLFHAWERRLASVTKDRVVRPFEWGLDWIPANGGASSHPPDLIGDYVSRVMADSDAFFTPAPTADYALGPAADGEQELAFPSAFETPHVENNLVRCRYFRTTKAS